jgi:hypothetical protein
MTHDSIFDRPLNEPPLAPERRYPALRAIAMIYKVLAWLVATATVLSAVVGLAMLGSESARGFPSTVWIIASLVVGALVFVSLWAAAETVLVFVDIEQNTRQVAETLQHGRGES